MKILAVGLCFAALLAGCDKAMDKRLREEQVRNETESMREAEEAEALPKYATIWRQTEFAANLYREAVARQHGNVVLSPYGVASVFSLLGTGARGDTQKAFSKVLCLDVADTNAVAKMFSEIKAGMPSSVVSISDSIWLVDKKARILPEFMNYAQNGFGVEARTVGLAALYPSINKYVCEKTHGMISRLLDGSPDPLTRLAVVNTVYFKGKWAKKFNSSKTRKSVFHAPTGDVQVQFMNDKRKAHLADLNGLEILRLPYRSVPIEAVFILPPVGRDMKDVEGMLNLLTRAISGMTQHPYWYWGDVEISIPKFEFESTHDLRPILSSMGLGVAFGSGADFSEISAVEDLYVGKTLQKAKIRVDEEGTEAAAATAAVASEGRVRVSLPFIADRPFMFVIRNVLDNTILFMGCVVKP